MEEKTTPFPQNDGDGGEDLRKVVELEPLDK